MGMIGRSHPEASGPSVAFLAPNFKNYMRCDDICGQQYYYECLFKIIVLLYQKAS